MSPRIREPDYSVRWMASNAPKELEREFVDAFGKATLRYATEEAPEGTGPTRGTLKRSGIYRDGRVRFTAAHALFVHEGTRPHLILPRRKPFLAWQSGGQWHYAKRVHHPGTKPNRFVKRGMDRAHNEQAQIGQPILDAWLTKNRLRD